MADEQAQEAERETTQTGDLEPPDDALVLRIPDGAKLPDGATFYQGEDDTRCRLIKPDGQRCRSTRMRATGLCGGHSGIGLASSPDAARAASRLAATERANRASARISLGISARRAAQPLQASRVRAQARAEDYAAAIVDGPLDDGELGTVQRQQAAIRALELLYPQASISATVDLPTEADEVGAMGWQEMQALAQALVTSGDQATLDPA